MTPRIAAALPWYDEPVAWLDRCVRSLEGVADELVALDGRWRHFDDDAPVLSHWSQAAAIARAADAIGLEHRVWMGPTVWESQVSKRAALMELAAEIGDWVLVIDADEWITGALPQQLREQLAGTELDVATVRLVRVTRDRPTMQIRRLFRAGTTVVTAHNGYRYGDQWLHGDTARVRLAPALNVGHCLELTDASSLRGDARSQSKLAYRRARVLHRLEAWV